MKTLKLIGIWILLIVLYALVIVIGVACVVNAVIVYVLVVAIERLDALRLDLDE